MIAKIHQELKLLNDSFLQYLNIQEKYISLTGHQHKTPIVKIAECLIDYAHSYGASDIHLEPQEDVLQIRYRIDGILILVDRLDIKIGRYLISYLKVASNLDIAEKRLPQDGKYNYHSGKVDLNIRISTIPILFGEKMVLRLLGNIMELRALEEMDFSCNNLSKIKNMIGVSSGLVVVTGPVNSGKSTLLYSCIDSLNKEESNIVTIEDPIELNMPNINQMQVNPKAGLDFSVALRACLRQDPDVVMIGEIRDDIVAKQAIRAALTGHLVLSTLHTANVWGVPSRLLDMGISPMMISIALLGMIGQRLVRRLCPYCKIPYEVEEKSLDRLILGKMFKSGMVLYKACGCIKCKETGFIGRLAIQEVLMNDKDLKDKVSKINISSNFVHCQEHHDFLSLLDDARVKLMQGDTTTEEIFKVISGVYDFE